MPSKTIPDFKPKWAKCIPVFRPKQRKNPTPVSYTHLRAHETGRNYVCILSADKNNSPNSFRIRIFLFLSYLFGIKTINTFIHSGSSLETIPDFRPKWAKCIPVFRPKQRKNPTRWGGTYLLYVCLLYTSDAADE